MGGWLAGRLRGADFNTGACTISRVSTTGTGAPGVMGTGVPGVMGADVPCGNGGIVPNDVPACEPSCMTGCDPSSSELDRVACSCCVSLSTAGAADGCGVVTVDGIISDGVTVGDIRVADGCGS